MIDYSPKLIFYGVRLTVLGCLLCTVSSVNAHTGLKDEPARILSPSPTAAVDCRTCHTCDTPTRETPCLSACPRSEGGAWVDRPPHQAPDTVLLDDLVDRYLPVPFDHKGHARMADMAGGCASCHHYSPKDQPFPACRSCHDPSPVHHDIHKPGLKGAYHRQCLNCHREWSDTDSCSICHMPRTTVGAGVEFEPVPTQDDITGRMHPPVAEPDTEIFGHLAKEAPASRVLFRHKEHIHRFGLACVECHHESNCSRCHQAQQPSAPVAKTLVEHHQPCMRCHDVQHEDGCGKCHWNDEASKPPPFDHAQTGWKLSRHHERLGCRECHKSVPFARLDSNCNSCHGDWSVGKFDHSVTGQILDENHVKAECTACHADKLYTSPPTCDECHEEDEGIGFPSQRPGRSAAAPTGT